MAEPAVPARPEVALCGRELIQLAEGARFATRVIIVDAPNPDGDIADEDLESRHPEMRDCVFIRAIRAIGKAPMTDDEREFARKLEADIVGCGIPHVVEQFDALARCQIFTIAMLRRDPLFAPWIHKRVRNYVQLFSKRTAVHNGLFEIINMPRDIARRLIEYVHSEFHYHEAITHSEFWEQ